ncbi:MAG: hypothetical protein HXX15_00890 [Rhodopseudomonas sp.]|uniref:HEPN domain-containing protein n=1 Tax=Rhodopseudomonas sp. TaxID=1078 RepID=UPI001854E36F|nr:HEPN domain-containing protein [Rhodopseudomonas sp.]NVN84615.1 hypothetical protein [Rhodopseudomonas sp.]
MLEGQFKARLRGVSAYLRSLRELEKRHKTPGKGFYGAASALAASRAASFIMIYNCVEYATRETIVSVRKRMEGDSVAFIELEKYWQHEILEAHFKKKFEDGVNHISIIREFASFTPGKITWLHKKGDIPFSGSIDHEKLIKFAKDIGDRNWRPPHSSLGGSDLKTVKIARNALAHGEDTFEVVGSNYSIDDISDKLKRIKSFMCSFIKMMERYEADRKYLN